MKWHVLFISDGTGITVEAIGHSLMTQFPSLSFESSTHPFMNSRKLSKLIDNIKSQRNDEHKFMVFSTLIDPNHRQRLEQEVDAYFDLFATYTPQLSQALNLESSDRIGVSHSLSDDSRYQSRIEAVNFSLLCDDGNNTHHYEQANVIIIGVSRSGKTPTSLYMAMTFGTYVANYPLSDEELQSHQLPKSLLPYQDKLFGLTIDAERLHAIRNERRPNSQYALLKTCRRETDDLQHIYQRYQIPYIDATSHSVEEIATKILAKMRLQR